MAARRPLFAAVLLAGGVLAAGCGSEGDTAATKGRLVEVVMTEMAFTPSSLTVAEGERITFRFVNNGNVVHEAVLGDADYQREHEAVMNAPTTTAKGSDHGAHTHDASNAVTVGPGATMELTWTAPERGTVQIGCHQPGHYAAGMKAELQVG